MACPNEQCTLFGIAGKGNVTSYGTYVIDSGKVRKYICHTCGTRFCDRTNTAFYDQRTSEDKVRLALEMVMKGMSINGIAEVLKSKPFEDFEKPINRNIYKQRQLLEAFANVIALSLTRIISPKE
jgi:hypothetical protein